MKSTEIAGENFVNANCGYSLTNGGPAANLYDQDPGSVCSSSGSAEGTPWQVTVTFQDRNGLAVKRTIDRLIFLGCNLSQFYVEYLSGGAWTTIAESVFNGGSPNAAANLKVNVAAPVQADAIRVTATNTIGAVAEKSIGELKACLSVLYVRHLVDNQKQSYSDGGSFRLFGGGLVAFQNVSKYEAAVTLTDVSLASYELIKPLLYQSPPAWMTWTLYEDFRMADCYELAVDPGSAKEVIQKKPQLYTITCTVKER